MSTLVHPSPGFPGAPSFLVQQTGSVGGPAADEPIGERSSSVCLTRTPTEGRRA